jgi:hypothetical protein
VVNGKEKEKALSPQFIILERELICQILNQKTFMRVFGASGNNIFSVS